MTAPRSCRQCGAALNPDIRWCSRCYAPVTEFAPRERQIPPPAGFQPIDPATVRKDHVWIKIDKPVYSRLRGGPTTLGLWGRLTLTTLVVLFLPWGRFTPGTLFYLIGYLPIAGLILRGVWRKEPIGPAATVAIPHEDRTIARIRVRASAAAAALVAAAAAAHSYVLGYLPALMFVVVAVRPRVAEAVDEAIQEAQNRPVGTLVLLNGLNLLDAILSDAAIGAGTAKELNPFVMAIGAPAKLVLVAALSSVLFRKRPGALIYPTLVFVVLTAYHLTGLLGGLALAN